MSLMIQNSFGVLFVSRLQINHRLCRCDPHQLQLQEKPPMLYNSADLPITQKQHRRYPRMDMNSLAHTKWECKYHIVFAPKFRRKVIYGKIKADVRNILSMLCKRKGIEIIEAECMPDHVHMFVRIPPKYSVSQIVGYLKGKSFLMIFERNAKLKYKYESRHFWCCRFRG